MSNLNAATFQVLTTNTSPAAKEERRSVSRFPSTRIRVCVLQMDPLRAIGLQAIFEDHAGIEIVIKDAVRILEGQSALDPSIQIVVLGVRPGVSAFNTLAGLRMLRPNLSILIMSPAAGDEVVLTALNAWAQGFLHETATQSDFEEAIRVVASGSIWASRRLLSLFIARLLAQRESNAITQTPQFTAREQQVLDLLLDGRSNREIAKTLKIEERTVKSYVAKLMRKVGVKNRTALSMRTMSAEGLGS